MTLFEFCAALLGSTIAYIAGDAIWQLGRQLDDVWIKRAGCLLLAGGVATLIGLFVWMFSMLLSPASAVWGITP